MKHHDHILIAPLLLLFCAGCFGQIEPEPLVDDEGNVIPVPEPYEDWLRVVEISPKPGQNVRLDARPTFAIRFNQYLEDDSFKSYQTASLRSGGLGIGGTQTYLMTTKTLLWEARSDLRPGFEYTFQVGLQGLRSVTNSPRIPKDQVSRIYLAVDDGEQPEDGEMLEVVTHTLELSREPVAFEQVAQLFAEKGCYSCHGQSQWPYLTDLTRDELVGEKSTQRDLFLVRPNDPTDSYLMHKLLPDYPIREGTVQPPPWSETGPPLTTEELWLVERWIRGGAD